MEHFSFQAVSRKDSGTFVYLFMFEYGTYTLSSKIRVFINADSYSYRLFPALKHNEDNHAGRVYRSNLSSWTWKPKKSLLLLIRKFETSICWSIIAAGFTRDEHLLEMKWRFKFCEISSLFVIDKVRFVSAQFRIHAHTTYRVRDQGRCKWVI